MNISFEQNDNEIWITIKKNNFIAHISILKLGSISYSLFQNKKSLSVEICDNIENIIKELESYIK